MSRDDVFELFRYRIYEKFHSTGVLDKWPLIYEYIKIIILKII